MKFTNLKIENFLAISEGEVNLADRGLVLIQGANLDDTSAKSNGAGKSTLADALSWALYGITARDVTGDAVVNTETGKGTRVSVDIEDGDNCYRVIRHRKHKTGKNKLQLLKLAADGEITDLSKGTDKLTQPLVDKIIGSSHEVFASSVYAGQEKMPNLPALTDKALKVLIEEAAGVTLLEEAYKNARDRLGTAKEASEKVKAAYQRQQERHEWAEKAGEEASEALSKWSDAKKTRIAEGKTAAAALKDDIAKLDEKIATLDIPKIKAEISACDRKIEAVRDEQETLRKLQGQESAAIAERNTARDHLRDMKVEYDRAAKALETVEHKIGCPCDECGREITEDEIAAARAAAKKKLTSARTNLRSAKEQAEDAQKSAQERTDKREAFVADMTDISATNALRSKLLASLQDAEKIVAERGRSVSRLKDMVARLKEIAAEENPHKAAVEKHRAETVEIEAEIDRLKKLSTEHANLVEQAQAVVTVFGPAGVRAHILDEVTPFLNDQTARYLSILSDGNITATWTTLTKTAKGELREKFAIEVEKEGCAQQFNGLSGGEKRKVRLATALAMQDLVATRALKPIELFIGDEIDDALDEAGLERLTQILDEKAKERGSVFVISHNSLTDWISNAILVTRKDRKSTMSELSV